MKVYSPNDLYKIEPERTEQGATHLKGCYYNHIPELDDVYLYDADLSRIEVRFIKDWCYDGRRVWQLASVWFDGSPCMVVQNAGREGDDFSNRFITNRGVFSAMIEYIRKQTEQDDEVNETDSDRPEPLLTEFYSQSLNGVFKRR